MPMPTGQTLPTIRPMISASVDIASKYTSAFSPTRAMRPISAMVARPTTTVVNITGVTTTLIALMNPSPNGFRSTATCG